jgi:hypothetical protein
MKYNLIKTDNYLLVVDGCVIEIENFAIHNSKSYREEFKIEPIKANANNVKTIQEHWNKIISHLPLRDAPILEGVPLLPPLEDDVEKLDEEHSPYPKPLQTYEKGFNKGYNKAREKYKFTEEDIVYAISQGFLDGIDRGDVRESIKEVLSSLKQPKLPIAFECDEIYIGGDINDSDDYDERDWGVKTFINFEGRIEWVGKYIYE